MGNELREFIDSGYGCFTLDGECVDNEYIYGLKGIEEINADSWLVKDGGMYKVLSYM